MADQRNRARGVAFREGVALVLRAAGLEEAEPRRRGERLKLSERIAEDDLGPDVVGLPDVWLDVRADISPRWSGSLDSAEQGARLSGRRFAAVVQWRSDHGVHDSFAIMTLDGFAALLKEAQHADALR